MKCYAVIFNEKDYEPSYTPIEKKVFLRRSDAEKFFSEIVEKDEAIRKKNRFPSYPDRFTIVELELVGELK